MYRFHPQHRKVREFLDAGRIGDIISMHARFHFVMDRAAGEVRLQPGLEGGAVNDVDCYAIDIMNMVMGSPPASVYATGTSPSDPVETTVAAILDYDGVLGTLDCGFDGPRTNTFQIIGTEGQITLDKAFDPDPGESVSVKVSFRNGQTEVLDRSEHPFKPGTERNTAMENHLEVTPERMREILGHFCTGLTIITAKTKQGPAGFTCQSFSSLSLEPALVAFNPARTSSTWPVIRATGHFCINILPEEHRELSGKFARSGTDKFSGVSYTASPLGNPVLDSALAWIDCELYDEYNGGDHTIVLGRVKAMDARGEAEPLLFYKGSYVGIGA